MEQKTEEASGKSLRKLSRLELVEIIVQKTKENEELKTKLFQAEKKLEERELLCKENGSIAKAALEINKIFETAQKAADDYLRNIQKQNPDPQKNLDPMDDSENTKKDSSYEPQKKS